MIVPRLWTSKAIKIRICDTTTRRTSYVGIRRISNLLYKPIAWAHRALTWVSGLDTSTVSKIAITSAAVAAVATTTYLGIKKIKHITPKPAVDARYHGFLHWLGIYPTEVFDIIPLEVAPGLFTERLYDSLTMGEKKCVDMITTDIDRVTIYPVEPLQDIRIVSPAGRLHDLAAGYCHVSKLLLSSFYSAHGTYHTMAIPAPEQLQKLQRDTSLVLQQVKIEIASNPAMKFAEGAQAKSLLYARGFLTEANANFISAQKLNRSQWNDSAIYESSNIGHNMSKFAAEFCRQS